VTLIGAPRVTPAEVGRGIGLIRTIGRLPRPQRGVPECVALEHGLIEGLAKGLGDVVLHRPARRDNAARPELHEFDGYVCREFRPSVEVHAAEVTAADEGDAWAHRQLCERGWTEHHTAAEHHAGPPPPRSVRTDDNLVKYSVRRYVDDVPRFR